MIADLSNISWAAQHGSGNEAC